MLYSSIILGVIKLQASAVFYKIKAKVLMLGRPKWFSCTASKRPGESVVLPDEGGCCKGDGIGTISTQNLATPPLMQRNAAKCQRMALAVVEDPSAGMHVLCMILLISTTDTSLDAPLRCSWHLILNAWILDASIKIRQGGAVNL